MRRKKRIEMETMLWSHLAGARDSAASEDWFDMMNNFSMAHKYATSLYGFNYPDGVDEAFSRAVGTIGAGIIDAVSRGATP